MKFVTVAVADAAGAILAHALRLPGLVLEKGKPLDSEALAGLHRAGVEQVTVARLEPGDVPEDRAAARVSRDLAGAGVIAREAHTGRVNLCATARGLLLFDAARIDALNSVDEAITIATLPLREVVEPRQTLATIKVNPYAVSEAVVAAWEAAASPLRVAPFQPLRASLIQTVAPGLKPSVLEKTARATRHRLEALGGALVADIRSAHEREGLARDIRRRTAQGDDLVLICGAYSTADRQDVVPAAIVEAGGRIEHFGMPVDPGNLLALGAIGSVSVIGMPGCARTSQLNGFDHVLRLVMARQPVGAADIRAMGVGGLLKDAAWRAAPKAEDERRARGRAAPARIAAVVLAAGQSSRMGENKLTLPLDGKPVLRHVADALRVSRIASVHVVLGHQADEVRALFCPGEAQFVLNEDYRDGLSTSLRAGIAALPADVDAAMIFLGDMPDVDPALVDRMIAAFDPQQMREIVLPQRDGRRGHPVLWGRRFFPFLLEKTSGDSGARHLIGQYADWVVEIEAEHDGAFTDLDTPEAFAARTNRRRPEPDERKILADERD
jgi:molybdenum cofactor cytidylyltransferase